MKSRNIVFHVTLQYMKKNRIRTVTTFIGIMLMTMLLTCVFTGKDTVMSYLEEIVAQNRGRWHVLIEDTDRNTCDKILEYEYIEDTAVSYRKGFVKFAESVRDDRPYILVTGYSEKNFEWQNVKVTEGRLPENDSEIVLSESVRKDGIDLKIGDTVSYDFVKRYIKGINKDKDADFPLFDITVPCGETQELPYYFPLYDEDDTFELFDVPTGECKEYEITGFIEKMLSENDENPFYTGLTYAENAPFPDGTFDFYCQIDPDDYRSEDYYSDFYSIDEKHPVTNDMLLIFSARSSKGNFNMIAEFLVVFFSVFIISVSIVLIYNLFNTSFDERRKYLGMLSSVGATRKQKKSSIYYEGSLMILVSLPLGILAGIGMVKAGMELIKPVLFNLLSLSASGFSVLPEVKLIIEPVRLAAVALIVIVSVCIASFFPAHKIGKSVSVENIRGTAEKTKKKARKNSWFFKHGKPEFMLATQNLKYNRHKNGSIVRAMTVLMTVVMVISYGTDCIVKMADIKLTDSSLPNRVLACDCGYIVSCYDGLEITDKFKREIKRDNGAEIVDEILCTYTNVDKRVISEEYNNAFRKIITLKLGEEAEKFLKNYDENRKTVDADVHIIPDDEFFALGKKCKADDELLDTDKNPVIIYRHSEFSTDDYGTNGSSEYMYYEVDNVTNLSPGEKFSFICQEKGNMECTLAALAGKSQISDEPEISYGDIAVYIPETVFYMNTDFFGEDNISDMLFIKISDPESQIARLLMRADQNSSHLTGEFENVMVTSKETITNTMVLEMKNLLSILVRIISYSFMFFVSMVCIINLYNSVCAGTKERLREMAVLRSAGMQQKQINVMLFTENTAMLLTAVILAAVLSSPLIYLIKRNIERYFGVMRIPFPVYLCIIIVFITAVSLCFVSYYCSRKKNKANILEMIRTEMV